VVGWPPVSRNRRNAALPSRGKFVKVAVAGAPYQRKVDLEAYAGYDQLLAALQDKFTSHFTVRRKCVCTLHRRNFTFSPVSCCLLPDRA
jgi:auxin-responsive protein IAA